MPHTRLVVRRVLCPVDLSDGSARALEHAVRLARFFDADLRVVHVLPSLVETVPPYLAPADYPFVEPRREAEERLAAFVEPVRGRGVPVEAVVRVGRPARAIEEMALEVQADVIVMATHGRTGLGHLVLGSVTERVLRRAACPVMAVSPGPAAPTAPPYRNILCATDLTPGCGSTIDLALALATQSDARLGVLHVIESMPPGAAGSDCWSAAPEFEALRERMVAEADDELRRAIRPELRQWCAVAQRVATGEAAPAILEAARVNQAELIVMGAHAPAIDRALFGSTIHRVIHEAPCPVLVLRQPRRAVEHPEVAETARA